MPKVLYIDTGGVLVATLDYFFGQILQSSRTDYFVALRFEASCLCDIYWSESVG